jgi:hypothetical protein
LIAHGAYNLDEIGFALLAIVAVCVIGVIAWVGGARDRRGHDGNRDGED